MGRMHKSFMTRAAGVAVAIWTGGAVGIAAQEQGEVAVRAIPAAVDYSPGFERALQRGWRSEVGAPGHSYWQNWAGYEIEARLDPETAKLEGTVQILYAHDAPANLNSVFVHPLAPSRYSFPQTLCGSGCWGWFLFSCIIYCRRRKLDSSYRHGQNKHCSFSRFSRRS